MNLNEILEDNDKAVAYLESVRWKDGVVCPYCKSDKTCKHHVHNRSKKWQCWNCKRSFSVTVGTFFHRTHIPLNKWFSLIDLMLNSKEDLSSYKAATVLLMRRPTVGAMMNIIRQEIETDQMGLLKEFIRK